MIVSNYADRQTPQFRVLSDAQCRELFLAALQCLERVGVQVRNDEARELLAAAGAHLGPDDRVRIPAHIIQDALASTPRAFTLWDRDGRRPMPVAQGKVTFGPGLTCTNFIDPETGERRRSRRSDCTLTARLCDALENIDYCIGLGLIDDVTPQLAPVYEFAELVANTTKPIVAWGYKPQNVADIYRIATAVAGGEEALRLRPRFAFFATFETPLRHADNDLADVFWAAEHGIPVIYLGGPTMGLRAPATGAATMVIFLATALSGLAIIQLKRRGAPTVIGSAPQPMDLRTARPAYGGPEMSLHAAAASDLCRYLEVPFMGTGGASESKLLDSQAAMECSFQVLMSALSGAAMVHDLGFLDCADTGSLPLLVLIDEAIAMAKRIMRGIVVNADTIMMDLIDEVGPGQFFIAEPESVALCRKELWVPTLMDRNPYAIWHEQGAKSMEQRIAERLRHILHNHQPEPLADAINAKIQAILAEAEQREVRSAPAAR
ncbi:MAG TPA: trimethylamine methyltransferase family protein [Anaerolineae bacterium]|nr:trimethylamine methyltransferase family protein [Anaerolineae bacterium]HOQ97408.1 trimethylamine methyltransferase family protein [Anaerolineae bacterium]